MLLFTPTSPTSMVDITMDHGTPLQSLNSTFLNKGTTFSTKLIDIHHEIKQTATCLLHWQGTEPLPLYEALSTCVFHISLTWLRQSSLPGMFLHLPSNSRLRIISRPLLSFPQVSPSFLLCSPNIYSPNTLNSNCL